MVENIVMRRKVYILNHYAGGMLFDKGGRHYWFAKYLVKAGYEPVIFCCNNKHNPGTEMYYETKELWEEHIAEDINTPFVFVKACLYRGNGIKRVFNMLDFYCNVKRAVNEYSKMNGRPDIIVASSVHPLTLVAGLQIAKKFGIKCICEVRDLWPEAIVAYSKRVRKNSIFAKAMYSGEKWIYKKADAVIFTQEGGPDYVCEHGWDKEHGGPIDKEKLFHINNGVDLEDFDANLLEYPYADEDLDNEGLFKVVYTGAIRRINNLGIMLDAAKLIDNPKIKFLIFGSGDELERLKERVINEKIKNVVFKGRVNKQFIPSIVSKADLNIVHWEMNPLLKVGESYNKAFEYFAAGKPVFYTIRPGYSIVEKYNCGLLTEGFEPKDIAAGIIQISKTSRELRRQMGNNARETAQRYDFMKLTGNLISIIERV